MRSVGLLPLLLTLAACATGEFQDSDSPRTEAEPISWADEDGDGIIDLHEGFVDPNDPEAEGSHRDSDGDGTPDYLDLDSDDDGLSDEVESGDDDPLTLPFDSDYDGTPDYLDLDSDDNCIDDADETQGDKDQDDIRNFADLDDDGDGIIDAWEIPDFVTQDYCAKVDSDGDGKPDYLDLDSDGDSVGDMWEAGTSAWQDEPGDMDADGVYNFRDLDADNDGLSDDYEGQTKAPKDEPADTDNDGIYDFLDIDSDGDGVTDATEVALGLDPYDDDTDGDGFSDGAEIAAGTDPLDASSVITGLYVTVQERTRVEEPFEFTLQVQMGDVAFLIDTTGSMGTTLSGMANEFSTIVSQLSATLPDAEYAVATYDDYAYGSYGYSSYGDRPFILKQQVTDNSSRVQSVLSGLSTHYGGDGPESGMEALYQGLSGKGFDQDCDNNFDTSTDVRPFRTASTDAFSGGGGQSYNSSSSGGGTSGGFGFRDYALPVVVYATDNALRDPDNGYGSPSACSNPAGFNDVVAAAQDQGAYLMGIHVNNYTSTPTTQMQALARATDSYADTDGDGKADDLLAFKWSGSSASLRSTIVNAISDLAGSVRFSEVSLEIDGDVHGFVTGIDPATYPVSGSVSGQVVTFTLDFRGAVAATEEDQIFNITLNVIGDGSVLLDTLDIYVKVPGSTT